MRLERTGYREYPYRLLDADGRQLEIMTAAEAHEFHAANAETLGEPQWWPEARVELVDAPAAARRRLGKGESQ